MSAATAAEEEKETVWDSMSLVFFSAELVVHNEAAEGFYPAGCFLIFFLSTVCS